MTPEEIAALQARVAQLESELAALRRQAREEAAAREATWRKEGWTAAVAPESDAGRFSSALIVNAYRQYREVGGNFPTRFLQGIRKRGGVGYAKYLVARSPSAGLDFLAQHGRLDLSSEAAMQKPEFCHLFIPQELGEARRRVPLEGQP